MSTRAKKIPELPTATSIAGTDLLIVEKVTSPTSSTTSKVTASSFVNYLITSPLGFSNVSGNIIPSSTATYNIGSNTKNWNNLYVSNTVFINNTAITVNTDGDLVLGGIPQIGIISNTNVNWETANTILALGQAAINSNTFQIKIGDGSTAWHDLKYATMGQSYFTVSPTMGGEVITPSIPGQSAVLSGSSGDITTDTYYGGYAVLYGGISVGNTAIYEGGEGGGIAIFGGDGPLVHDNTVIEDIYYTGDNDVHVTITGHNLYNGDKIQINSVSTETTLNGTWYVEYQNDNNFILCSSYAPFTNALVRLSSIGLDPWNAGGGTLNHSKNGGELIIQAGYPISSNYGKRGNAYIDSEYMSISAVAVDIEAPLGISGNISTLSTGSNISLNVANNIWTFGNTGVITFPTLTVPISDNANPIGTGQTLKFSDSTQQAIIYGPASTVDTVNAERIIIQGAPGYTGTSGEGGDVYLWAGPGGSVDGYGGDIKVRAGQGIGTGGGGYLNFQAGDSQTGYGGYVNIESGEGPTDQGGYINIRARNGGDINLYTNQTANIALNTESGSWTFSADGRTTLPGALVKSTVAKTGADPVYVGSGKAATISVIPTNNTNLTPGIYSGIYVGIDGGFTITVTVAENFDISAVVTSSNAGVGLNSTGTLLGTYISGLTPADDLAITVTSLTDIVVLTALDLTKSVNKLTEGNYALADGVEGQIMYMVPQNIVTVANVFVTVANWRYAGSVDTNGVLIPFNTIVGVSTPEVINTDMCTLIYTDGCWQASPGTWV